MSSILLKHYALLNNNELPSDTHVLCSAIHAPWRASAHCARHVGGTTNIHPTKGLSSIALWMRLYAQALPGVSPTCLVLCALERQGLLVQLL